GLITHYSSLITHHCHLGGTFVLISRSTSQPFLINSYGVAEGSSGAPVDASIFKCAVRSGPASSCHDEGQRPFLTLNSSSTLRIVSRSSSESRRITCLRTISLTASSFDES